MSILKKLKNDDFSKAAEELQARLQAQLKFWDHDPVQKRAAELELESFERLVKDERMLEVWQKVIEPDPSKGIVLLHRAYQLRGSWYFHTYKEIKDRRYYKDRQAQYERLKKRFLDFLQLEIYEGDYADLELALRKIDEYFEPPKLNNLAVYNTLPRKMRSENAEDVYLQMCLVEEMLLELRKPNYRLVATMVDVLLAKGEDDTIDTNAVQHNTSDIASKIPKGPVKI